MIIIETYCLIKKQYLYIAFIFISPATRSRAATLLRLRSSPQIIFVILNQYDNLISTVFLLHACVQVPDRDGQFVQSSVTHFIATFLICDY